MAQQLTFDLPARPALGRDAFFVAPSNAVAVATLATPDLWPNGKMLLVGDTGAGKTHLTHVWAAETGGKIINACDLDGRDIDGLAQTPVAVENIDTIANEPATGAANGTGTTQIAARENALFHLHNQILANGHHLLMTARTAPSRFDIALPDLKSRLLGTAITKLDAPDDQLITAVLVKLFHDRQLVVSPDVVAFVVPRMDRSLAMAQTLVAALDRAALSQARAVTRPLAAEILAQLDNPPVGGA